MLENTKAWCKEHEDIIATVGSVSFLLACGFAGGYAKGKRSGRKELFEQIMNGNLTIKLIDND